MKRLRALISMPKGAINRAIYFGFIITIGLLALRVSVTPPLGWDSLSYHAVKAGLWVQEGKQYDLIAPSGWTCYRTYPAGSVIPIAWAMLPFHSDLLTGVLDWFELILTTFALYVLCRALGMRSRPALVVGLFFTSVPPISRAVGALYADTLLTFYFLTAVTFAVDFIQKRRGESLYPLLMALGLLSGIKVTGGLLAAAIYGWLAVPVIFFSIQRRTIKFFRPFLIGTITAIVVAMPWYIYAIQQTGYPLSPMPVKVFGIILGQANPEVSFFQTNLKEQPYQVLVELRALRKLFGISWKTPKLTLAGLIPCLVFLPAIVLRFRKSPAVAVLLLVAAASVLAAYFQPGFSVVRLRWASSNGRFLIPMVGVALATSMAVDQWKNSQWAILAIAGWALFNFATASVLGLSGVESLGMCLILSSLVVSVAIFARFARPYGPRKIFATIVACVLFVVPLLQIIRDDIRYSALGRSWILHPLKSYWSQAARSMDNTSEARTIAVTAGVNPQNDNLLMYYFLGSRLQNHLIYVPITRDNQVFHFGQVYNDEELVDCNEWVKRLRQADVSEIMSFRPRTREFEWMESRPDLFQPIQTSQEWGAFSLQPESPQSVF